MIVIGNKDYKELSEQYRKNYTVFKVYNYSIDSVKRILLSSEKHDKNYVDQYDETDIESCYYLKDKQAEYVLFGIVENNGYIQFCLGGKMDILPEMVNCFTQKKKNFGYGQFVPQEHSSNLPYCYFSKCGEEITRKEYYEYIEKALDISE